MNKIIFSFILLFFFKFSSYAQAIYGNEWINFDQPYLKIEIEEDGIYRVTFDDIQKAGFKSFKNLSVYHHGKLYNVAATLEENTELKPGGYLEFYAEKNKGDLDSLVYRPNNKRNNPYQSLFSDVSAYFLVSDKNPPLRIENEVFSINSLSIELDRYSEELIFAPNKQYSYNNSIGLLPNLQQSYYEPGEGWSGNFVDADTASKYIMKLENYVPNSPINIRTQLNGRSRETHNLSLKINNKLFDNDIQFGSFEVFNKEYQVDYINNNTLEFLLTSNTKKQYDWYSVTYFAVKYHRLFKNLDKLPQKISISNSTSPLLYFKIPKNVTPYKAFIITDLYNQKTVGIDTEKANFGLKNSFKTQQIFIGEKYLSPKNIRLVRFEKPQTGVEFLILTHKNLSTSALSYANYRASPSGGGLKTSVLYIDDVYDKYFYGEKNPEAIKRMLSDVFKTSNKKFLLLLGRPVTFPEVLKTNVTELVASYGYPGSDVLLSAGLFGNDTDVQGVATGRLNVTKNQEVLNYLQKLKDFETNNPSQEWRKRILHLSGGQTLDEIIALKEVLNGISPAAKYGFLGAEVITKTKKTDNETEEIDISKEINQGASMLTFTGHGSPTITDLNIGFSSNPTRNYTNKNRYPLLFFNGCGVGNIFFRYDPLSTDWLLTPDKGAIAVLANSFWSYLYPTQRYLDVLYEKFFNDKTTLNLSIGEVQQAVNTQLATAKNDPYILANMHQMVLQGDPALKIFAINKPDYLIAANGLFITSQNQIEKIEQSDSIRIGVLVNNFGKYDSSEKIEGLLQIDGKNTSNIAFNISGFAFKDTIFIKVKNDVFIKKITLKLDAANKIDELNEDNNNQTLTIDTEQQWVAIGKTNIYPEGILPDKLNPNLKVLFDGKNIENNSLVSSKVKIEITLSDESSLNINTKDLLKVTLKKCDSCTFKVVQTNEYTLKQTQKNVLTLIINEQELKAGKYTINVLAKDMSNNYSGLPFQKNFEVINSSKPTVFSLFPNPTENFVQLKFNILDSEHPKQATVEVFNLLGKRLLSEPIEANVGNNSYYLSIKDKFGSNTYIVKIRILKSNNQLEEAEYKVVVR